MGTRGTAPTTLSAFMTAKQNGTKCNGGCLDIEKWVSEMDENITRKHISTVDDRNFWFATSNILSLKEAQEHPDIDENDVLYVNRGTKLDAVRAITGTQKIFHVRGEARVEDGKNNGYPVHTSTMPCACPVCLKGNFMSCKYLKDRGNVKRFVLRKVKENPEK